MTTVDLDGEDAADGLVALVVAVVEILVEALEREAVRRMESGRLTDEQIDRLGRRLAAIEEEIERLKSETEVEDDVADLRSQLDGLVREAVDGLRESRESQPVDRPESRRGDRTDGRRGSGQEGRRGSGQEGRRGSGQEGRRDG